MRAVCATRRTHLRPIFKTHTIRGRGGANSICRATYPDNGWQFQFRSSPQRPWTYVYCGVYFTGRKYTAATVRSQLRSMCRPAFQSCPPNPYRRPPIGEYRYILCTWRRVHGLDGRRRKGWRAVIEYATPPVELSFK